ncbi:hypothetical protein GC209_09425 [bacterium]|nr:hypothetical protein [bacterium]
MRNESSTDTGQMSGPGLHPWARNSCPAAKGKGHTRPRHCVSSVESASDLLCDLRGLAISDRLPVARAGVTPLAQEVLRLAAEASALAARMTTQTRHLQDLLQPLAAPAAAPTQVE